MERLNRNEKRVRFIVFALALSHFINYDVCIYNEVV